MENKVLLGGTCNNSTWRDKLIPYLKVNYFNPVVENWDNFSQAIEEIEKNEKCNIHLYVITSEMVGVFSIAEAVVSAHIKNKYTVFTFIPDGFTEAQRKSLIATGGLILGVGGITWKFKGFDDLADLLNTITTREGIIDKWNKGIL